MVAPTSEKQLTNVVKLKCYRKIQGQRWTAVDNFLDARAINLRHIAAYAM